MATRSLSFCFAHYKVSVVSGIAFRLAPSAFATLLPIGSRELQNLDYPTSCSKFGFIATTTLRVATALTRSAGVSSQVVPSSLLHSIPFKCLLSTARSLTTTIAHLENLISNETFCHYNACLSLVTFRPSWQSNFPSTVSAARVHPSSFIQTSTCFEGWQRLLTSGLQSIEVQNAEPRFPAIDGDVTVDCRPE